MLIFDKSIYDIINCRFITKQLKITEKPFNIVKILESARKNDKC